MPLISRPSISRPPATAAPSTPQPQPLQRGTGGASASASGSGNAQDSSLLRQALGNATTAAAGTASNATPKTPLGFEAQEDFISFDDGDDGTDAATAQDSGTETSGTATPVTGTKRGRGTPSSQSARKRKREAAATSDIEGSRQVRLRESERRTPWSTQVDWDSTKHPTHLLNDEAQSFMRYISPTTKEHEMRLWTIELVRRAIVKKWKGARVECFGSVGTGLYLPGGDIDLVIICDDMPRPPRKPTSSLLHRIAALLLTTSLAEPSSLIVIAKARVPIVKFTSRFGGFSVDISINQTSGLDTAIMVRKLLDDYSFVPKEGDHVVGVARSLTMMVKMFLNQRGLNEVFTGGLGSYAIICMVISFLQVHPKIQNKSIDPASNLGLLFLEFLELYGKHFNYDDVGITIKGRGGYFDKDNKGWYNPQRPFAICIEDPNDPTNDISAGSFNILQVRGTLAGAFDMLSATLVYRLSLQQADESGNSTLALSGEALPNADAAQPDPRKRSILGSVIGLTAASLRHRRANEQLYDAQVLQRLLVADGGEMPEPSEALASITTSEDVAALTTAMSRTNSAGTTTATDTTSERLTKKQKKAAKKAAKKAQKLSQKEKRKLKKLERKAERLAEKEETAPENMEYIVVDSSGSASDQSDDSEDDEDEPMRAESGSSPGTPEGRPSASASPDEAEEEEREYIGLDAAAEDESDDEQASRYTIRSSNNAAAARLPNDISHQGTDGSDDDDDSDEDEAQDYVLGGASGDQLTSRTMVSQVETDERESSPATPPRSPEVSLPVSTRDETPRKQARSTTVTPKKPRSQSQRKSAKPATPTTATPPRPGKKERDATRKNRRDFWAAKGSREGTEAD